MSSRGRCPLALERLLASRLGVGTAASHSRHQLRRLRALELSDARRAMGDAARHSARLRQGPIPMLRAARQGRAGRRRDGRRAAPGTPRYPTPSPHAEKRQEARGGPGGPPPVAGERRGDRQGTQAAQEAPGAPCRRMGACPAICGRVQAGRRVGAAPLYPAGYAPLALVMTQAEPRPEAHGPRPRPEGPGGPGLAQAGHPLP